MRKIQLTITINFIFLKDDNDEECLMHLKSENIKIIMNGEIDEVTEELFKSLQNRYQNLEKSVRSSAFVLCLFIMYMIYVLDYVHLFYYKCHRKTLNYGGSNINSPDSIKNKKAAINPINKKDNKCFQYAVKVALNNEEIGKNSERVIKSHLL